ncbi:uncharacterized protein LOC108863745 [Galendromus occidentalis]|uniref:Uncharacterized protein LOC108863745 n=1 Tax=Galendromus occidentalis TaxID=34638 RepID=A0AAJ7L3L8_9ACAR|nr:uncharacterized protein LOC108863745 [Galendromus occidentalis]
MSSDTPRRQIPDGAVSRKAKWNSDSWEKTQSKLKRHCGEGKTAFVDCSHAADSSICQANKLTQDDLQYVNSLMYQDADKVRQDAFITSFVGFESVQRRRPRAGSADSRQRDYTAQYSIPVLRSQPAVRVCAASFRSIMGVGAKGVHNLMKFKIEEKCSRPERRGGRRINEAHEEKKKLIREHIERFQCKDSHNARANAPKRQYLSSVLSVSKMHTMFLESHPDSGVGYKTYYHTFASEYNLAFGHPRTDVCSTCVSFTEKLRVEQDEENRKLIVADQALHRSRAKKFHPSSS